jgi:hypothetical protein
MQTDLLVPTTANTERAPKLEFELVGDPENADGIYLLIDGVRVAHRGHPGTPNARTWVSLDPRYAFRDNEDMTEIVIDVYPTASGIKFDGRDML